jgi:hypothetical protein
MKKAKKGKIKRRQKRKLKHRKDIRLLGAWRLLSRRDGILCSFLDDCRVGNNGRRKRSVRSSWCILTVYLLHCGNSLIQRNHFFHDTDICFRNMEFRTYRYHVRISALRSANDSNAASVAPSA